MTFSVYSRLSGYFPFVFKPWSPNDFEEWYHFFSYSYHYSIEEKRRSNVLGRNSEKEAAWATSMVTFMYLVWSPKRSSRRHRPIDQTSVRAWGHMFGIPPWWCHCRKRTENKTGIASFTDWLCHIFFAKAVSVKEVIKRSLYGHCMLPLMKRKTV